MKWKGFRRGEPKNILVQKQHCKHIDMDIRVLKTSKGSKVKFVVWHGGRKHVACLRTVKSMIENMITGVTKGFLYKVAMIMRMNPHILIEASNQ